MRLNSPRLNLACEETASAWFANLVILTLGSGFYCAVGFVRALADLALDIKNSTLQFFAAARISLK